MTHDPLTATIALRARADLVVQPQSVRNDRRWCVKDPVSLAYFHLSDEEYALLRWLDGRATVESLRVAFERRFPHRSLGPEQLTAFLAGLSRNGLVTSEAAGEGERLWNRRQAAQRRSLFRALPNLLAIRFRGIDPSGLLRGLYDLVWWIYSPVVLVAAALFVMAAAGSIALRLDEFVAAIPKADAFLTARNLALLFVAIGVVKVLHELGHGLTCLRYGGECHEMGIMLLVFTPCLYCDVSDSWLLPEKRRRIAVAAAGIVVELFLAAVATFGWWLSEPGLFHSLCLNVMLVCSINTLWFNGNPLLRYDGYFILSDLIEIPNLAAESRAALTRLAFGREPGDPPLTEGRELTLLAYGVLSAVYRIVLTAVIVWICLKFLTPVGLAPLGYALGMICMAGLVAGPVTATKRAFVGPRPRRGRALLTLAIVAGLISAAVMIPLPRRVEAVALLQPREAVRVYAPVGGTLREAVAAGQSVRAGDLLGRLDDPTLEREVIELEGRRAELTARLDALESRRHRDPTAAGQIPSTRKSLDAVAVQLTTRRTDLAELRLVAPKAGTVLPPPVRPPQHVADELAEWSGTPLDPENIGCRVEPGTLFCLVGDPKRVEAALHVAEDDVGSIRPGQRVRLLFTQRADTTLSGVIEAVAADPIRVVPPELARAGSLAVRVDDAGMPRPVETIYEVRVRLDEETDADTLRIRGVGQAKVSSGSETISARAYRFLRRTFRFEL